MVSNITKPKKEKGVFKMKMVGVCACPTGVAHTYLAAAKLIEQAESMGHTMKVEKQGSLGFEDQLKPREIREADVVVMALMVGCEMEERFIGKKVIKVSISDVLKDCEAIIKKAEDLANS